MHQNAILNRPTRFGLSSTCTGHLTEPERHLHFLHPFVPSQAPDNPQRRAGLLFLRLFFLFGGLPPEFPGRGG
ncbi:MAG: hypothetical protein IKO01_08310 [Kiritimatiellae bacterium]|nr:hypothetical protein [Kiritimatiellia bacterium]